MKNGFELWIYTNGFNYKIIEKLLEQSKSYHLTIKVSLDGLEAVHNEIRGNNKAYYNVMKTLEMISHYPNITLFISTTVLRNNIDQMAQLDKEISQRFPNAIHTKDLAFPLGNADSCTFSIDELPEVEKILPELLVRHGNVNYNKMIDSKGPHRCSGGISQCTLMCDGNLKICNAACDKQFYFKHNAYQKGLKYAWLFCGKKIRTFRKEKAKSTPECRKCLSRETCQGSNCRLLAWVYTGKAENPNPLTCYATKKQSKVDAL